MQKVAERTTEKTVQRTEQSYLPNTNFRLTLDMEDHRFTDMSLYTAKELWNNNLPLSIVLQSRLHRTENDIFHLFSHWNYPVSIDNIGVRICIGIYNEPKEIAVTSKKKAKKRLLQRVEQLSDYGVYIQIASHDKDVVYNAIDILERKNYSKSQFEVQGLMGVPNTHNLSSELTKLGYNSAIYYPFEIIPGAKDHYLERRLMANPDIIGYGLKNLIQSYFSQSR